MARPLVSTGWASLDRVIDHLWIGDNVVWMVETIEDYARFAAPFVEASLRDGRQLHYLRFAEHRPLVAPGRGVVVQTLDARRGFEHFTTEVHRIITREGAGAFYVFDCLSDLLSAWATDRAIGNFFRVTCPNLYRLDTVAYFGLLHGRHSHETINLIRQTTQVLLSLHRARQRVHVHPLKVDQRASPTMFLPHVVEGDELTPVADSAEATRLWADLQRLRRAHSQGRLDYWHRLFLDAEAALTASAARQTQAVNQICQVMIGRDDRMVDLARRYFGLADLLDIQSRMIGTGYIGGKAVGMLLARKVLEHDTDADWSSVLEPHDSFYVGSDVYYWYLVHNGWWDLLMQQKAPGGYYAAAEPLRQAMLQGEFPDAVRREWRQMLEYFGQYPILVRSSSLLEDSFGGAFAGKYDSVFLVNQGSPEHRLQRLDEAVRRVFASSMSADALAYRAQRGLDQREEPMALLIQRVSGRYRGAYYFPDMAGVGVSCNTFAWRRGMDPQAGMLRLVMGLGTRAVDRLEGDYAAVIALDEPMRRPHHGQEDARRYSQHEVDVLDIGADAFVTAPLRRLIAEDVPMPLQWTTTSPQDPTLTFEPLLKRTDFAARMRRLLKTLEGVYDYPVDVEFTVSMQPGGRMVLNLVQCRPLQARGRSQRVALPADVAAQQVLLTSDGTFMGGSADLPIHRIIRVDPDRYALLTAAQRYETARIIGRLNRAVPDQASCPTMLIGPGRWGTSTPSLGVPVSFSEINHISVLVEISGAAAGMSPDLSFGTHFFHDLVETQIFYVAVFPERGMGQWRAAWFEGQAQDRSLLAGEPAPAADAVCVYDVRCRDVRLVADALQRRAICWSSA